MTYIHKIGQRIRIPALDRAATTIKPHNINIIRGERLVDMWWVQVDGRTKPLLIDEDQAEDFVGP